VEAPSGERSRGNDAGLAESNGSLPPGNLKSNLRADRLYTGISSGPNVWQRVRESFHFFQDGLMPWTRFRTRIDVLSATFAWWSRCTERLTYWHDLLIGNTSKKANEYTFKRHPNNKASSESTWFTPCTIRPTKTALAIVETAVLARLLQTAFEEPLQCHTAHTSWDSHVQVKFRFIFVPQSCTFVLRGPLKLWELTMQDLTLLEQIARVENARLDNGYNTVEPRQWIYGDIAVDISAASTRTTNSNCVRQSRLQCRCTNFMKQSAYWHY